MRIKKEIEPYFVTANELSKRYNIPADSIRRWARERKLTHHRLPIRIIRFRICEVDSFLAEKQKKFSI